MKKKKPTIKDIAEIADVSPSLVSRVLNYDSTLNIPNETKIRVFEAAESISYELPKNRNKEVKKIGLFSNYTAEEELEDVYYLANRVALERNLLLTGKEIVPIRISEHHSIPKIDGLICLGLFEKKKIDFIHSLNVPTVFVDSSPDPTNYFSVGMDLRLGASQALQHLFELNHTRIGYIGAQDEGHVADDRELQYRLIMESKGLLDEDLIRVGRYTPQDGYKYFRELMALDFPPTAIFIANDSMAMGLYKAAHEMLISIPNDVSVIGFNNLSSSDFLVPSLTTIHLNIDFMCRTAVTILEREIEGKSEIPTKTIIPTYLVVRESTKKKI